jgi:hypothetical protein
MDILDFNEKVTIKFKNTKPVEVIDFLNSIHAFQKQYKKIIEEEGLKYNDEEIKLYIQVREGSLEWVFTTLKIKAVQDAFAFVITEPTKKFLKKTYDFFTAKINQVQNEEDLKSVEVSALENTKNTLQPTKNDLASKFTWEYEDSEKKEKLTFEITGATGRGIYDKLEEIILQKKLKNDNEFENKILQLAVSNRQNSTAIRGIIGDFDEANDYQIGLSDAIKDIIKQQAKPFEGYYLVNGNVKLSTEGKIVLYYITKMEKIEV